MYRRYVKRLIDVVLSLVGLVFASWLYLFIIIAIKIDDHGPVFFIQTRIGINKKEFKLVKFRSMKITAPHDKATCELENPEQHITRVGKFLRKTSLDEIPQLWNILKGDMSIIGPRPVIGNEIELLNEREKYGVYSVKPGLSGWAQVNGRDLLGTEDKARLDGEYVEKMSFAFDCRCFFITAFVALRRINVVEGKVVEVNTVKRETSA
jgi:O-antigen biosynthesis protein WbqP